MERTRGAANGRSQTEMATATKILKKQKQQTQNFRDADYELTEL
jgi:hypothetical protein